jgi:amino acid transporter
MENERVTLGKTLKRKDIWAFCFGAIVGWGWIMLAGNWIQNAGTLGAIIAFVFGAIMAGLVGIVYAELTPMLPIAGGEMVWAYRSGGYKFGWFTGWAICFAYVAVAAWEGPAFATAVSYLIPLPQSVHLWTIAGFDVNLTFVLTSLIGSCFIIFCHFRGMRMLALFNTTAAVALVLGGIIFFVGSVSLGEIKNAIPLFNNGITGIQAVMMMAPAMFIGFDVIPQASEEMDIPLKQIGWMVIFAIALGALWYIAMIAAIGFAVPKEALVDARVPLADAASMLFGSKIAGYMIIVAGIGGILTSWNAMFVGATRIIFGMARAKMLPPIFAKKSEKYGTPQAAILLVGIVGMLGPFLGKNALGWFVDASSLGAVIAYLCVTISFILLRIKEPDLLRPWKVRRWKPIAVFATVACICFICLYMPFSPSALTLHCWAMVILWIIIGIVLTIVNGKQSRSVTLAEREQLVFGPFSRKEYLEKKDPR